MEEEMRLMVEKAFPIDIGRGVIRLDPAILLKLQLSPDDIVEIKGNKKTAARVWKADKQDWEKGFVRMDNFVRQSAGASVGDTVTIKKAEVQEAKKLVMALPESINHGVPELKFGEHANDIIKRHILKRPVFKGDIIPIINPLSQSLSESLFSQVIPLIVIKTDPSNTMVQISESTDIELLDRETQVSDSTAELASHAMHVTEDLMSSQAIIGYNQILDSIKNEKEDSKIDIMTLSEAIVKNKDHYEKIFRNVKEHNTKYDNKSNTTLLILGKLITKSDKVVFELIYNLKLEDAFNYVNELESKIDNYHKAALSEIAHRKIKEIEFQINHPFFFSNLLKDYKKVVNELGELDIDGVECTKEIKDFIEALDAIMNKIVEIEDDLSVEKRKGLYSVLGKTIWGIPLIGIYNLIAINYIKVNSIFPIILGVILVGIIYLLFILGSDWMMIQSAYKRKSIDFRSINLPELLITFLLFSFPLFFIIPSLDYNSALPFSNSTSTLSYSSPTYLTLFIAFVSSIMGLIFFYFILRNAIKEIKTKLIKEEINILIIKYDLDHSMRP